MFKIPVKLLIDSFFKYYFFFSIKYSPLSQAASVVCKRAANPILSLGITLFNICSKPSALAIANWLNSTKCSFTNVNLEENYKTFVRMRIQ